MLQTQCLPSRKKVTFQGEFFWLCWDIVYEMFIASSQDCNLRTSSNLHCTAINFINAPIHQSMPDRNYSSYISLSYSVQRWMWWRRLRREFRRFLHEDASAEIRKNTPKWHTLWTPCSQNAFIGDKNTGSEPPEQSPQKATKGFKKMFPRKYWLWLHFMQGRCSSTQVHIPTCHVGLAKDSVSFEGKTPWRMTLLARM